MIEEPLKLQKYQKRVVDFFQRLESNAASHEVKVTLMTRSGHAFWYCKQCGEQYKGQPMGECKPRKTCSTK